MTNRMLFRIWMFLRGGFILESFVCPNCGEYTPIAPGNWPRKEQARTNRLHWKECIA